MEHGEKLASMIQLRELQTTLRNHPTTGITYSDSAPTLSGPIWDLIQLVGEKSRQNTVLLMDRDNSEVFYSKVSELEQTFHILQKKLNLLIPEDIPFQFQIQRACELSTMCVTLINTAMNYKEENYVWYPSPEGITPWYCRDVVRSGMWSLALLMVRLVNDGNALGREGWLEFYGCLEVFVKVLLEVYSGAVTAKVEREEEHGGLLEEYWSKRDMLLDSLYQQVKSFNQDVMQEQNDEIAQKLSSNLLAIAKRHEGYQTLWNLCFDHNDLELLRSLMHDSMGPKGGFSNFVFKQMYNNKQFSKLMRLGEEFPEELSIFLKDHQDLLWLHEIFLHQFPSSSETLHSLALSNNDDSTPEKVNQPTLTDRRRLLNLSKIAAVAGKSSDDDNKLKRIDADLRILNLQQEILKLLPDTEQKDEIAHKLLPPSDLIHLCLGIQNKKLALYPFEIFAWSTFSFLKGNSGILEECWKNAANQDDWASINEVAVSKGLSDDEMLEVLKDTTLFQASRRCYGSERERCYEGGFEEVLPLRQDGGFDGCSVEGILMQHRSFPDADKLMVMAIMLGSVVGDVGGGDPME